MAREARAEASELTPYRPEAGATPGRGLLAGGDPHEILRRLHAGDPLSVRSRAENHARKNALVLDSDRLYVRSLARVAHDAAAGRVREPLSPWLDDCVAISARELLREDLAATRPEATAAPVIDGMHTLLAYALKIEPLEAPYVAAIFNQLHVEQRAPLYAVLIERRTMTDVAAARGITVGQVRAHVTAGLNALATARPPEEQAGWSELL